MSLRSLACFALLAAPAAADVIVVDPAGGNGAALLQAALDGAADGDVILVRPGVYGVAPTSSARYETPDRSLHLVADGGSTAITLFGLKVEDLSAGREIVVHGFGLGFGSINSYSSLEHCAGTVVLEDCSAVGGPGFALPNPFDPETFWFVDGQTALFVNGCTQVVLERVTATGGAGLDLFNPILSGATHGGPGLAVRDSRVVVADGLLTGGESGSTPEGLNPSHGGAGLGVDDVFGTSHVIVLGGTLQGGAGGSSGPAGVGGAGGIGLISVDAPAPVWVRETVLLGGAGGAAATPGAAGAPISVAGSLTTFDAPWASVNLPAPLRGGDLATLEVSGTPGDVALVFMALQGTLAPLKAKQGALLADVGSLVGPLALGAIGGGGTLAVPFVVPALPAGLEALPFPLQLAVSGGSGTTLGGTTRFVWVDPSF